MTKKLVIIITVVSAAIFLVVLFLSVSYSPNDEIIEAKQLVAVNDEGKTLNIFKDSGQKTETIKINPPDSLYVPAVGINAPVFGVGLTTKGNIASPKSYDDVGWYKYGPRPGEPGTAILDGHVDNGLAQPGVFKNLGKLVIGDHVYVVSENNATLHFVVEEISVLDYDAPTDSIFIESGVSRLVLITCTGDWMPDLRTHDKRLLVTAVLFEN